MKPLKVFAFALLACCALWSSVEAWPYRTQARDVVVAPPGTTDGAIRPGGGWTQPRDVVVGPPGTVDFDKRNAVPVPEPSSLLVLASGLGIAGLLARRLRKRQ